MAQAGAKGDIALTIDERGLEASLRFTPDPEGAEWTAEKLMRLVMDARLGGFNQKKAEDLLSKFSRSRGPATEIIAKGQPPEEPRAEEPEWADLVPPPGLDAIVAATIAETAPPELYKVRIETTRVERKVKKPAALPFLPPKIETVVEQEKREVRERVYPDTEVVKTGFAKKGERVCILSTAKPGKAGKSIFGKPIPPQGHESAFILGEGVARSKNEVLADIDGVVRGGTRWVEVIPLAMPSWSVSRSHDGATWFLDLTPGDPRLPAPEAADILKAALEQGAPEDSLATVSDIAAIVAQSRSSGEPLCSRSLSLARDGKAEVTVSPDGVKATISVWKGRGTGRPLTLAMVTDALKASGVKLAKPEQFKKDILEFYKGPQAELLDCVIAEGRAPTRGKDRTVSLEAAFYPAEKADELKARLSADPALTLNVPSLDDFPMDAVTRLAPVQAGQRFGEVSAQSVGQPGVDIHGKPLPGLQGNDPYIRTFENVEFVKGALTALVNGLLMTREAEGAFDFRVIPFRDSSIDVTVSADSMSAYLSLQAGLGLGKPLSVEAALAALQAKGVTQGINSWAVAEAIAAARAGKAVLRHLVASGRPARQADTGKRVWLIGDDAPSSGPQPKGAPPLRVAAGAPLLRIEPASGAAEPGVDVLGRPIAPAPAAQAGAAAPAAGGPSATGAAGAAGAGGLSHDASIREERDDKGNVTFIAASPGEFRMEGQAISVAERYVVKGDVGMETGNVRFSGPVNVLGTVRRGFQLFAGGDTSIAGGVEASLVSSDGAVAIAGGIKGDRKGTIRAGKTVDVGFAEQALLLAVGDIRVRGNCALCSVKTNGRLLVGGQGGALTGGLCRARKGVDAMNIGSERSVKTEISFGQDYLVADMIEAEEREIEKIKALVVKADRDMAEATRTGAGLDQARQDKVKLMKLLEKRSIRLFDLREKFEEHFQAAEVRVRGTIYPGVILESHNRFYEVRSRKSGVVFTFDQQQGRITERQL
jgi:uncharacterized protein (DUF342 family)